MALAAARACPWAATSRERCGRCTTATSGPSSPRTHQHDAGRLDRCASSLRAPPRGAVAGAPRAWRATARARAGAPATSRSSGATRRTRRRRRPRPRSGGRAGSSTRSRTSGALDHRVLRLAERLGDPRPEARRGRLPAGRRGRPDLGGVAGALGRDAGARATRRPGRRSLERVDAAAGPRVRREHPGHEDLRRPLDGVGGEAGRSRAERTRSSAQLRRRGCEASAATAVAVGSSRRSPQPRSRAPRRSRGPRTMASTRGDEDVEVAQRREERRRTTTARTRRRSASVVVEQVAVDPQAGAQAPGGDARGVHRRGVVVVGHDPGAGLEQCRGLPAQVGHDGHAGGRVAARRARPAAGSSSGSCLPLVRASSWRRSRRRGQAPGLAGDERRLDVDERRAVRRRGRRAATRRRAEVPGAGAGVEGEVDEVGQLARVLRRSRAARAPRCGGRGCGA